MILACGFYPPDVRRVLDADLQKRGVDLSSAWDWIELKIVRWPGYSYSAVTLEEWSNLELGRRGWMDYSEADILDYCFAQPRSGWIVWRYRMQELRRWFEQARYGYPIADTMNAIGDGQYTTRCRVIELADIANFSFAGPLKISPMRRLE